MLLRASQMDQINANHTTLHLLFWAELKPETSCCNKWSLPLFGKTVLMPNQRLQHCQTDAAKWQENNKCSVDSSANPQKVHPDSCGFSRIPRRLKFTFVC